MSGLLYDVLTGICRQHMYDQATMDSFPCYEVRKAKDDTLIRARAAIVRYGPRITQVRPTSGTARYQD
jgi:hypothetical protein